MFFQTVSTLTDIDQGQDSTYLLGLAYIDYRITTNKEGYSEGIIEAS